MTIQEFREDQRQTFQEGQLCCTERYLSHYMAAFDLTNEYIKKLDGKKLLLVGGGRSPIQKTFDRLHINCDVTNVDPYINEPKSARTIINKDFVDVDFVNKFDACWALWSLPLYSPNAYHAATFYARAAIALKPGGALRVFPRPRDVSGIIATAHLNRDQNDLRMELKTIFAGCNLYYSVENLLHKSKPKQISETPMIIRCNKEHQIYERWRAPKSERDKKILNEYMEMRLKYYSRYICDIY